VGKIVQIKAMCAAAGVNPWIEAGAYTRQLFTST
jgi:hypothetical protein